MKDPHPRHSHYIVALVAIAATVHIVSAGSPYLYAQEYDQPVVDTVLTTTLPVDSVPSIPPEGESINPPKPQQVQPLVNKTTQTINKLNKAEEKTAAQIARERAKRVQAMQVAVRKITRLGCSDDAKKLKSHLDAFQKKTDVASEQVSDTTADEQTKKLERTCDLRRRHRVATAQLDRLEKLMLSAGDLKSLGITSEDLKKPIADLRARLKAAKENIDKGETKPLDQAQGSLEKIGTNEPQHAERVLIGLRQLNNLTKIIKDETTRTRIQTSIKPIVEAIKAGKYAEARKMLEAVLKDLVAVIQLQLKDQRRGRPSKPEAYEDRLKKIEKQIRLKQGTGTTEQSTATTSNTDQTIQ